MDTAHDYTFIDIDGLPKAAVLAVLYNFAEPPRKEQALLPPGGPYVMELAQAETIIVLQSLKTADYVFNTYGGVGSLYFEHLYGRYLGIDLTYGFFNPSQYDAHNGGVGSAHSAIEYYRATKQVIKRPDCDAPTWTKEVHTKANALLSQGDPGGAIAQLFAGLAQHPETEDKATAELTKLALTAAARHGHQGAFQQSLLGIGM